MMRLGRRALQNQPDKRADSVLIGCCSRWWVEIILTAELENCFETENIHFLMLSPPAGYFAFCRDTPLPHTGVHVLMFKHVVDIYVALADRTVSIKLSWIIFVGENRFLVPP